MPSRLALYGLGSTALFGIVVSSTLKARPNFYSAAVALGRSSGASLILANFALFNAIWLGVVLKTVFFGRLRSVEYEVSGWSPAVSGQGAGRLGRVQASTSR